MNEETYFTIKDPDGHLVHTMVATEPSECVENWISTEQAMHRVSNAFAVVKGFPQRCAPSWEAFEAQGYRIVKCKIVEVKPQVKLAEYCEHPGCFAIFGINNYERTEDDCNIDPDGDPFTEEERKFVSCEPITLCDLHAGDRKPVGQSVTHQQST